MLWIPRILLIAFICTIALARPDDPEEDDAVVKGRSPCLEDLQDIFGKILGALGGE
ncbi:uncharacterized protein LOC117570118 isoform X6 [Drosophila albomicans]|uniref:Uncharacterized protein LOC117570118 isoform X6 n=1 Tax=Drosophila albomicans TaxID=7291 RepID=A0A9C6T6N8_DROAB|nr:uncharacterized protein LOC117570118 isoform X6 [Drosophila albomicans]